MKSASTQLIAFLNAVRGFHDGQLVMADAFLFALRSGRRDLLSLDSHKHPVYIYLAMIRSFADGETERFFTTGKTRRLPREILRRAAMRLRQLDAATRIEDLRLPPSNRLELLKGHRAGQHSIRINDQWRVCFQFADGDAFKVEITDYH